uniref:Uncharacterized protein n=1 Tax=Anguilla anguilla TaxID=7936 RepID=A0A0E9P6K6_ANGAN
MSFQYAKKTVIFRGL